MVNFRVFLTQNFTDKLSEQEKDFQEWVQKIFDQLAINPFVGKPLGTRWLREKKFGKHRIYYLVSGEFQLA